MSCSAERSEYGGGRERPFGTVSDCARDPSGTVTYCPDECVKRSQRGVGGEMPSGTVSDCAKDPSGSVTYCPDEGVQGSRRGVDRERPLGTVSDCAGNACMSCKVEASHRSGKGAVSEGTNSDAHDVGDGSSLRSSSSGGGLSDGQPVGRRYCKWVRWGILPIRRGEFHKTWPQQEETSLSSG
jgi:hypothetical protein